ncbi:helix-turn-helix domain-containing protein [Actinoalloteichus hymeniacidonis]|uniref:DNA binding protein with helix-turn-helix domain n=1 Tax=Actinoalloteichus hymeniacidonis TaxID=340345 RepID=A0AAC9MYB3_9PSEU|nr:helix-turn-helix transcriptional regulator [Actinoalloteichus hymeniacidonis]AOS62716.1 DNA binding protein with helix-turn-helix domain [Actinoalloteichus hymeniacidonis]MBB5909253.1 transcriptional regulator with XRE-family HTH domain [Actinoalloteichus hymeniacidonis]
MSGPTLRRRQLGAALRELRLVRGISVPEASQQTGLPAATVSRIENGVRRVWPGDVRMLLSGYGVEAAEANRVIELAVEADRPVRWECNSPALDQAGSYHLEWENTATELRSWHPEMLPPAVHTDGYLRATRAAQRPGSTPEQLDEAVALGRARRAAFSDNGTRLVSIIGEGALRRLVGGTREMRDQLDWLLVVGQQRTVSIQVLPFSSGAHSAMESAFDLMSFDDAPGNGAVRLAGPRAVQILERNEDLEHYASMFDLLSWQALSTSESARFIESVTAELC